MSATLDTIPGAQRQLSAAGPAAQRPTRRPASDRAGEPGFVKRYDNFEALRAMARQWRGTATPKSYIADIITWLPDVGSIEKDLLRVELSFVSPEDLLTGGGGVTEKLAGYTARRISRPVASVKRGRRVLEAKGYLLRHVDGDNNSAKTDIRPFLTRVDELREAYEAEFEARRAAFDQANQFETLDDEMLPRGSTGAIHIQSPKTTCNPVLPSDDGDEDSAAKAAEESIQEKDAARGDSLGRRQRGAGGGPGGASSAALKGRSARKCSQREHAASLGGKPPTMGPRTAVEALLAAYQVSSRWRELVSLQDIRTLALDRLFASGAELVRKHFTDARRNPLDVWEWGVDRHGWKAIIMAVVSLEDPKVLNPGGYFNWLVTTADGIDLAKNLAWLPKHIEQQRRDLDAQDDYQAEAELQGDGGGAGDDVEPQRAAGDRLVDQDGDNPIEWPRFLAELRRQFPPREMTDGVFRNWFRSLAYLECRDGLLVLSVESAFIAGQLLQRYQRQILDAARSLRWPARSIKFQAPS
jgi:DnaA N-terminal domain